MRKGDNAKGQEGHCACPYCEHELESAEAPFCQLCRVDLQRCRICLAVVEKETTICPRCGAELDQE